MKKTVCIILIITFLLVPLNSCGEIEIVELNERLIIEAIGIDKENGKYNVTIEGLDSYTAGSDSNSVSGEELTKCYLFEGETIGMAMNSISVITGQIPLFSQARVLIIGRDTATNFLSEALDFFRREYTTRTDILIAVADGKASDIVSADFGKNVSAGKILESALKSYKHTGTSVYIPLYKFLNNAMNESDAAYCPLLTVKDNEYTKKKDVKILGTVVIGKNSDTVLSPEQTQSLTIINNDTENGDMTIETEKGKCTLEIIDSISKIKTEIINEKTVFDIKTKIKCDIPEFQSETFSGLSKSDTEKIAEIAAKKLTSMISDTITEFYIDKNFDIFNFNRRINLADNRFYSEQLNKGGNFGKLSVFNISVEVSVRRIGKVVLEKE
ncbi:MAG: Ger(x)C family spore germination protein [Clostridia bacterium]|nr:Ger(x)C family spore germination protein [Clostridia bacterium]